MLKQCRGKYTEDNIYIVNMYVLVYISIHYKYFQSYHKVFAIVKRSEQVIDRTLYKKNYDVM